VAVDEDGSAETSEKEVDAETETDNDGDVQASERGAANSMPGNEESWMGLTKTTIAVGEEEVADSTQTKRLEAYSCSLVARNQGALTRKGMVGVDH